MQLVLRVVGTDLPGLLCDTDGGPYSNVHVGVQAGADVVELRRADAETVRWQLGLEFKEATGDFRGDVVHGKRGDRFLYLCWVDVDAAGTLHRFRRAKLMLAAIDADTLKRALETGVLEATLPLRLGDGTPVCAAVRPPRITWRAA